MERKRLLVLLLTCLCGAGCALDTTGRAPGPQIWIDAPIDNVYAAIGEPVAVMGHSNEGIDRSILFINEVPLVELATTMVGDTLWEMTGTWIPVAAGRFHLRIRGYSGSHENYSQTITVVVMETHSSSIILATPTTTQAATLPAIILPTATPTPPTPVQIKFWADSLSLPLGGCTNLHWEVTNATAVSLNNETVPPQSQRQVCPPQTTAYMLHSEAPAGNADRSVTITVTAPTKTPTVTSVPDTTGPVLSAIAYAPAKIWDNPACGPTSATIHATANDPSGITKVDVHYRVAKGSKLGPWSVLTMHSAGGGAYTATLGPADGGSTVEYYITAQDGKGNSAQSKSFTFKVDTCLI
jgi:hypothetical protein